jgi:hypothetical protein
MKLENLRKLIREEIEGALDEADKAAKGPPKTFADFRKRMGAALKKVGADPALVGEVNDMGYEGGGVFSALWRAWEGIEMELKDAGEESGEVWKDMVEYYVHDAVIDMMDEYGNPMNYEPGHKPGKVDAPALAKATVDAMLGNQVTKVKPPAADQAQARIPAVKRLAKQVAELLAPVVKVTSVSGNLKAKYSPYQTIRFKGDPKAALAAIMSLEGQGFTRTEFEGEAWLDTGEGLDKVGIDVGDLEMGKNWVTISATEV